MCHDPDIGQRVDRDLFNCRRRGSDVPSRLDSSGPSDLKQTNDKRSSLAHAGFDDYDVLCEGELIGRIYNAKSGANAKPWFWCLRLP